MEKSQRGVRNGVRKEGKEKKGVGRSREREGRSQKGVEERREESGRRRKESGSRAGLCPGHGCGNPKLNFNPEFPSPPRLSPECPAGHFCAPQHPCPGGLAAQTGGNSWITAAGDGSWASCTPGIEIQRDVLHSGWLRTQG